MNSPPTPPVIVVTEERRRRRGLLWVAATAALVIAAGGAGTFALWSDTASFAGGTITAGDLDLHQVADTAFYDISSDRDDIGELGVPLPGAQDPVNLADTTWHAISGNTGAAPTNMKGHEISSIGTWRMVPGDTVAAVQVVEVKLVGDNLVAELTIDKLPAIAKGKGDTVWTEDPNAGEDAPKEEQTTNEDGFSAGSIKYAYSVYGTDGKPLPDLEHVPLPGDETFKGTHLAYFSAPQAGQASGLDDAGTDIAASGDATVTVLPVNNDRSANLIVVIEAQFTDVDKRTDVGAAAVIDGLSLSLKQLRAGTKAFDDTTGIGRQQNGVQEP